MQTSGSIICPADRNNVVGIKPTVGLVSRNAVLPLSPSQDTVGPLARTLRDAAAMLTVMAGPDDDDKRTGDIPFTAIPDYVNSARERDLSGTRIGIPRDALDDVPTDVMEAFDRAIAQLGKLGVETVDLDLSCASRYRELEKSRALFNSLCPEFNVATTEYLSALVMNPHNIKNMQDIIDFTKREPAEEYPKRDIHWFEASKCLDYSSPEYAEGLKDSAIFAGEQGIMGALDGYGRLDALLAPSCAELPNYAAARGGFPIVSVPLGYRPYGTPAEWNDTGNLVTNGPNMP